MGGRSEVALYNTMNSELLGHYIMTKVVTVSMYSELNKWDTRVHGLKLQPCTKSQSVILISSNIFLSLAMSKYNQHSSVVLSSSSFVAFKNTLTQCHG